MAENHVPSPKQETMEGYTQSMKSIDEMSYSWTIRNFSFLGKKANQEILSPVFSIKNKSEWRMKLVLNGVDKENEGHLSLFLRLDWSVKPEVNVKYAFSIIDGEGKRIKAKRIKEATKLNYNNESGFKRFIMKRDLPFISYLLPNDELTIMCEIKVAMDTIITPGRSLISLSLPEHPLSENLRLFFDNKLFSDVTLVVREREFQAHKLILAIQSPVFKVMFEKKETEEGRVDIVDMDAEIVEEVLRFIYTDTVKNLKTLAKDLFVAADKYELARLKAMCEDALCRDLTVETAAGILQFAYLHSAYKLKKHAIDFVNTYPAVVHTVGYETMKNSHSNLLVETFHTIMQNRAPPRQMVLKEPAQETVVDEETTISEKTSRGEETIDSDETTSTEED